MNTMRVAPFARVLAFSRTKGIQAAPRFGVSTMRMMSAAAPGPKVRYYTVPMDLLYDAFWFYFMLKISISSIFNSCLAQAPRVFLGSLQKETWLRRGSS